MEVRPYTVLAGGYDAVMEHVDYPAWAAFITDLLRAHEHTSSDILELGCGTATFASLFVERYRKSADRRSGVDRAGRSAPAGLRRYLATDGSVEMLAEATRNIGADHDIVEIQYCDYNKFLPAGQFDTVLLLYDGLNYILEPDALSALFERVSDAITPDGLFVFDQSTPANSINNASFFEDEGTFLTGDHDQSCLFRFRRESSYDAEIRLHETTFYMETSAGAFSERHIQRAYEYEEIDSLIVGSPLERVGAYDGLSLDPADDQSERIHWVCRKRLSSRVSVKNPLPLDS
jgi:SAM-dependent methyltransferase